MTKNPCLDSTKSSCFLLGHDRAMESSKAMSALRAAFIDRTIVPPRATFSAFKILQD
ncbi:MAG: hypothetical protein ACLS3M_05315 [Collinsella sp.]